MEFAVQRTKGIWCITKASVVASLKIISSLPVSCWLNGSIFVSYTEGCGFE